MTFWIKEQYSWLKKIDSQFVQQYLNTWRALAGFSMVASHTPYCKYSQLKKSAKNVCNILLQKYWAHTWGALAGFSMVASSPSQWAGWHKGGRLNLYSAFWRSHAHCAECPSTSLLCICICICICICSVQSVRLGGELRWPAMYVPPPPEFETQHTESHS